MKAILDPAGIFSQPKMPAAKPLPVQPTVDDARQAEEDLARLRKRRGRASTFLAGTFGKPTSAAASMLGSAGKTGGAPESSEAGESYVSAKKWMTS